MKKPRSPRLRMAFYREDILELQAILLRLSDAHHLDGCLLYSINGHPVTELGVVPAPQRELLLIGKRTGKDVGHGLRLAGIRAGEIIALEVIGPAELGAFLDGIAGRKESGERSSQTFGRPFPPPRA